MSTRRFYDNFHKFANDLDKFLKCNKCGKNTMTLFESCFGKVCSSCKNKIENESTHKEKISDEK